VLKFIATLFLLMGGPAIGADYTPALPIEQINSKSPVIEREIRDAAVKISVPFSGGHGSGSYIKYKDIHLVITAQHVVDKSLGTSYLISHKEESHIGILIYSDPVSDIGILYVGNSFDSIEPMKFDPVKETSEIGTAIYYSGYPSHHKLMSFVGRVAGHENKEGMPGAKEIILQTYGWFGCSGSVIYNTKGQQVGVLYGVDIEYYPDIQVQENMIWVAPINRIKIERALGAFCRGYQGKDPKACK